MTAELSLVTPTFRGDFARVSFLRESMARCEVDLPHVVVVADEDIAHLRPIRHQHRLEIVSTRDVLPRDVERLRRREARRLVRYLPTSRLRGRALGGWWSQQLVKLAASRVVPGNWICLDSDAAFVRSVSAPDFDTDGRLHLQEFTNPVGAGSRNLARDAARLFGVQSRLLDDRHYTGLLVPMHRATVGRLLDHLSAVSGLPWWQTLRLHDVTEYAAYGVFARYVDGLAEVEPVSRTWSWLFYDFDVATFSGRLREVVDRGDVRIVMVHSHLGVDPAAYRPAFDAVWSDGAA